MKNGHAVSPYHRSAHTRGAQGGDMRQDPNKRPIGRQPFSRHMAPSKVYPFYGKIIGGEVVQSPTGPIAITGGDRFTVEQLAALRGLKRDPETVETMIVRRQAKREELWQPLGELPEVFAFECPVIGRRGDKIRVITPSGDAKYVHADGWGHHPYRVARDGMGFPIRPVANRSGDDE